jgi:hypothetical protein
MARENSCREFEIRPVERRILMAEDRWVFADSAVGPVFHSKISLQDRLGTTIARSVDPFRR